MVTHIWIRNIRLSRGPSLWFTLVIGVAIIMKEVSSITPTDKEKITKGLDAGEAIAKFITSKEFSKAMIKIASSASIYLGALGPFIGVVLAFIPAQSAELTFMKEMMKQIDNRFDVLDSRFNDVERLIDWNAVKVNFGQIEQKILAMAEEYQFIYEVPASAVQNRKAIFLSNFESDYQNSGTKLYQAVMLAQGTFQENLGHSVMRYTKNNRKETQQFLLGVMQLLLQAVKIELASLQVKGFDANAVFMQNEWHNRIQEVRAEFERVDRAVRDKWHDQSGKDLLEYARRNTGLSSGEFSVSLYNLLKGKYYWRDWVVLAYSDIAGWDKHTVSTCGGHIKFRQNGRNIVIGSVDRNSAVMDLARAEREMKGVAVTKRIGSWVLGFRIVSREAREVYNSLNKRGACEVSVIKCYNRLHYAFTSRRFKRVSRCPHFNLNMWG